MVSTDASIPPLKAEQDTYPRAGLAWYAVFVLTVCFTLSYVDRQILAFLVTPLKADLGISDTQIGLLQGLAFAFFYTVLGLPMGLLADRFSRRNIIVIGVLFWSAMTALSAFARSFWSLTFARMGVGVGEATLNPCAFSMVTDYFPKERLASALSVYAMGIQIGSGLAMIVGGTVVQVVTQMPPIDFPGFGTMAPWRITFLVVGLPGIAIAALLFTIREPVRRALLRTASGAPVAPLAMRESFALFRERWRSILGIAVMIGCQAMCNYSLLNWGPAFFERVHGWSRGQIGLTLGLITLICGCAGLVVGGRLADRWHERGVPHGTLRVALINLVGVGLTLSPAMIMVDATWTLALLIPAVFLIGLPIGCSYAALQVILPNQARGFITAMVLFLVNVIGLGLGSLIPGLFTDLLFENEVRVGYSVSLTVALASIVGTTVVLLTIGPYRRDYARLHPVAAGA